MCLFERTNRKNLVKTRNLRQTYIHVNIDYSSSNRLLFIIGHKVTVCTSTLKTKKPLDINLPRQHCALDYEVPISVIKQHTQAALLHINSLKLPLAYPQWAYFNH